MRVLICCQTVTRPGKKSPLSHDGGNGGGGDGGVSGGDVVTVGEGVT